MKSRIFLSLSYADIHNLDALSKDTRVKKTARERLVKILDSVRERDGAEILEEENKWLLELTTFLNKTDKNIRVIHGVMVRFNPDFEVVACGGHSPLINSVPMFVGYSVHHYGSKR